MPSQALLVIADIGGYTQFMKLHRLSLAHSEEITGRLLAAAIEAAPELELVGIEGDAAITEELEGIGETPLHFVDLGELAELPAPPVSSAAGRVRETATVLGRGMPYLLGLKKRGTREAQGAGSG